MNIMRKEDEVSFSEIFRRARHYKKNNIPWHFHFLMPKCKYNNKRKYSIILENERTGENFIAFSSKGPINNAEKLENMFYDRANSDN